MPTHLKSVGKANVPSAISAVDVPAIVRGVIDGIRSSTDSVVRDYSEKFDKWSPRSFKLSEEEIRASVAQVPEQTLEDIKTVQGNVRRFALAQREFLNDFEVEMSPDVHLGQKSIPVQAVGAYIPGGRYALLASAHITIVTAKAAGVPRVIACTPPINDELPHSTIAAAHMAGADEASMLGGAQATADMAIGTETTPKVDFMAGPGNPFAAEAKRQLSGTVGIDLPAGPTEVLIVADEKADYFTLATDLLSQAEHGPDTPAILITNSEELGGKVINEVARQLKNLPTAALAAASWKDFAR